MKSISIFIYDLNLGGTEKVMVNLANYLSINNFLVTIIIVSKNKRLKKELLPNIKIISFNKKRIFESLPSLIGYIRQNKIDTFIANVWPLTIVTILAGFFSFGFNRKVLLIEHCHLEREFSTFSSTFQFLQKISIRLFYPKSYKVIAVSDGVGDDLIQNKRVPEKHVRVIQNPVAIEDTSYSLSSTDLSSWINFQGAKFISVGNLKFQKNYPYLIRTLAVLKKNDFHFKHLIIGEGPEREELEKLIEKMNLQEEVILAGAVDFPLRLIKEADIFILSSQYEGFGLVIVEALAAGTTVVSTDCDSGPSEILKDGELGYLAPIDDINTFSETILYAYKHQLSSEILIERSKDYSINVVGPSYLKMINEIM